MTATDRIRASILHEPPPDWVPPGSERKVVLSPEDVEALCDLADAARRVPDDGAVHGTVHHRSGREVCTYCGEEWPCPTSAIRDALARLDGEDGP